MKTVKKQKIISFIVLLTPFLYSCATTNQTQVTEVAEETELQEQVEIDSNTTSDDGNQEEVDSNTGKDLEDNKEEIVTTEKVDSEEKTGTIEKTETIEKPEIVEKTDTQKKEDDKKISRSLIGVGKKSQKELYKFFMKNNKKASKRKVKRLAKYYIEEAAAEGINSDVAFIQMCHETGFLKFGNLVTEDMNNFCGLGSMDANNRGASFETEQLGVRAHIQHLQAYATTAEVELHKELVDPRYEWVHKTKYVTDIFGLTGTWATDPNYSTKLDILLNRLEEM